MTRAKGQERRLEGIRAEPSKEPEAMSIAKVRKKRVVEAGKEKEEPRQEIQKKQTEAPIKTSLKKAKAQAKAATAYVATLMDAQAAAEKL